MSEKCTAQIHATTVILDGWGIVLTGPSGSGKSDLALRLMDRGALLVADDRTDLVRKGELILATAPAPLAGQLEVRGYGIVPVPHAKQVSVHLVVELVPMDKVERMPKPETLTLLGITLPKIRLCAFEASAAAKLQLLLQQILCN